MKRAILVVIYASVILFSCTCRKRDTEIIGNDQLCFKGTPEYAKKVQELKIGEDKALSLIQAFQQKHPDIGSPVTGEHYLLVGDSYLFSLPEVFGIEYTGYYVNGMTGEVEWRMVLGQMRWGKHEEWLPLYKEIQRSKESGKQR